MLSLIQEKPTIYLTSKSISALQDFLNGYKIWMVGNSEAYNLDDPDFNHFKDLILNKSSIMSGVGFPFSSTLLKECNGDEERAFERFFEYLNEYKATLSLDNNDD